MTQTTTAAGPSAPAPLPTSAAPPSRRGALGRSVGRVIGRSLAIGSATLVVIIGLWYALLAVFQVSPYLSRTPWDVFQWFVLVDSAAENRDRVGGLLVETLIDASYGFILGMVTATVVALLFNLFKGIEAALMPLALLLRSIPLVALAPILILIFGRGIGLTAVMGAIVVLFPALVTIVYGLRSASPQMADVVAVYGGSTLTMLLKVAFPSSLPSFFAAVRVSVPGAITGALLAEWLATGRGLGYSIQVASAQVRNSDVWGSVVAITTISILLYGIAQLVENIVLTRMGMGQSAG